VPVFALTNFGIESFAYAQTQYDFLNEFDRPYVSGHMRVIKPDPRIYEMVEEDSGLSGAAFCSPMTGPTISTRPGRGAGRRISSKGRRAGPRRWSRMAF
jgi:hypothetical protein